MVATFIAPFTGKKLDAIFILGHILAALITLAEALEIILSNAGNLKFLHVSAFFLISSSSICYLSGYFTNTDLFRIQITLATLGIISLSLYHTILLITDYRRAVEQNEQEAIRASEAKGKFLAHMSHEIRTPINAIMGMDEMILRNTQDEKIINWACDIRSASDNLLEIVNEILDISKIESGKMELIPSEYDVCAMIHDAVSLITPKASDKGLKLIVEVAPDIPSKLYGDNVRIRQIIVNLLSNAVKYTQKGSVSFKVLWKKNKNNKYRLHCEIEDTGIGIKKEDMPKLFEEYERIEENRNRNIEGTGLGMSITMAFLNLMGSRLKVRSTYGKGTLFWFDVKQRVVDKTPIGDYGKRVSSLHENTEYKASFTAPGAKVLVVDDNKMNRTVFKDLLADTLIKISEAGSGMECLDLLKRKKFDIIFLDHMMPEMDGVETLKRLKKLKGCESIPVIALTANALSGAKERYIKLGFDGFLAKPILPDKLEDIVRSSLPQSLIKKSSVKKDVKRIVPEIEGIDTDYAKLHFPQENTFITALKEYSRCAEDMLNKLETEFSGLPESMDRYRIHVHGMKSSAGTIGQIQLYGIAKTLEDAAKNSDVDTISRLHPILKEKWMAFSKTLSVQVNGKPSKKKFRHDEVIALISIIKSSMEVMDIDQADMAMSKLINYKFGSKTQAKVDILKSAVDELDDDAAIKTADEILARLSERASN